MLQKKRRVPKDVPMGEFDYIVTYEELLSHLQYQNLVSFEEVATPVGFAVKSVSEFPQLNDLGGFGMTEHLAMRDILTTIMKIITDGRKEVIENRLRI